MAAVYYAIDAETQQPVALKILSSQLAEIPAFRQRFELEAQITTHLQHPNIVSVVGYGAVDESLYIAMRYLSGGSLHDKFVVDGAVSLRDTARYLKNLASALDYAHTQGVIHRDLKLANVLLDEEGNALLSDFGIARMVESTLHLTDTGSVMGSPHYMSPEQSEGKPLDARSDLYSLAVMVYLMITGQFPFHADTPVAIALQHVSKPPPPPTSINSELPSAVDAVLTKGLAKQIADRFASSSDFSAAFDRAIGDCDTRTLIRIPQLSRVTPPRLLPSPVIEMTIEAPTEPSILAVRPSDSSAVAVPRRRQPAWRYLIGVLVLTVGLVLTLIFGLTLFNTPPEPTQSGLIFHPTTALPVTATRSAQTPRIAVLSTLTPTAVFDYSVVVRDLYTPANIRSGPGLNFKVIAQLYASDQAKVIARTGGDNPWFLIRTTQGVTGWVSSAVVDIRPAGAALDGILVAATIPASPTITNTPISITFTPARG
jgi:serine/threonine protein kinase